MKAVELRDLPPAELEQKLAEVGQELFNLRFQLATNQIEHSARLGVLRREVARIQTILRERELGIRTEVAP